VQYDKEYFDSEEFHELLDSYEAAVADGNYPFMDADDLIDIADYYNMSDCHDKAVEVVDHALQLYPNATLPNVFMAREALQDGDFERADQYMAAIEDRDDPDYHYLKAELLIAQEQTEQADRYLRDYGMTVPADEYEDFVKDCANLYVDYGISDKAYEWMLRSKGDNSVDFKELMARTLFGLGKYPEAQKLFNELIDADPYNSIYWNALASAQFLNEQYSDAVASSEYALAINPKDSEALAIKGSGMIQLGNVEEAVKYLRRYAEIIPDDYPFMAACCFELGYPEEFLYYLKIACEYDPEGTRLSLGRLFPEDMEVEDYYSFMLEEIKNQEISK
jgi:tetratricopeptide (TPR) repeat protein